MPVVNLPYFKPTLLSLILCSTFQVAYADDAPVTASESGSTELEQVNVYGQQTAPELGNQRVRRKSLDENMVQDEHDLVRYTPGVTVVEGGRAGSNGFAIRGVDKDRVAVSVDGLMQAESRSSDAFQEIFGAYGNYNTNRNAGEIENMSQVRIMKGADSVVAGSGALGGAVLYETKSAEDYLTPDKPYHVGVKTGYTSRNSQFMQSITAAGRLGKWDGLAVITHRDGHETKNFGGGADVEISDTIGWRSFRGVLRPSPDPQDIDSVSSLLKLGYHFNDQHYLQAIYEDRREDRITTEYSNFFSAYGDPEIRRRNDVSYRNRYGLLYRYQATEGPWDEAKIRFDRQKIEQSTLTWDMPEVVNTRNAEAMMMTRSLNHGLNQLSIDTDKTIYFNDEQSSWRTTYGGGYGRYRSTGNNEAYYVNIFNPDKLGSRVSNTNNLVSAQSNQYYLFWNNTLNFNNRYKLNLGIRYDHYRYKVLPDTNFNSRIVSDPTAVNSNPRFSSFNWGAGLEWNMTPTLTLQAKYNTAFRVPTVDELWFMFPHPQVFILPNPNLKEERARNIELGLDWHGDWGNLHLTGYRTRYSNFIDFAYLDKQQQQTFNGLEVPTGQNINRQHAVVKGLELQGRWNLDSVGLPRGMYATLNASYSKGEADGRPINAIQPFSAVWGLGYAQPENRWSLGINTTYTARKNPADTTSFEDRSQDNPFAKHSRSVWLVDVVGHYQLGKHINIRGGVYNLFNQNYYTWDSLRSVREFGTVNRVDNKTHAGITRFSAPGRNLGVVLEAKF